MNVVRMVGRACFAAFFIADGMKVAGRPAAELTGVQRTMDKMLPVVRRLAPDYVAKRLPDDATVWARWIGTAEIAAGVCYGSGFLARPAAAALCAASVPQVLAAAVEKDPEARQQTLIRGVALLGAAMVGTQDMGGRTSLLRRAVRGATAMGRAEMRVARSVVTASAKALRSTDARAEQ
jgi:uncharacterized membrane protein YphA (DoxX/SURF4 family)